MTRNERDVLKVTLATFIVTIKLEMILIHNWSQAFPLQQARPT
jgi:hypothetical protein